MSMLERGRERRRRQSTASSCIPCRSGRRRGIDRYPLTNVHMRLTRRICTRVDKLGRDMTGDRFMTSIAHVDDAQTRITETIKLHPIVVFMKGSPSRPQCGFSDAVVQKLAHAGVPLHALGV